MIFKHEKIEAIWQLPVLDSYGLKEHNVFIAQCSEGGYHIFPEYGICEILDDDGNHVAPGQEGWIVATGLHNYVQPLLRYNTLDRAVAGNGNPCRCGRNLPTIERLIGRIDDCLITRDGKRYSGLSFAFFGLKGLQKARLIQENLDHVLVEIVANEEFDADQRNMLVTALNIKVEQKLSFQLKSVNEIHQESPGKFKFVVSKFNANNVSNHK